MRMDLPSDARVKVQFPAIQRRLALVPQRHDTCKATDGLVSILVLAIDEKVPHLGSGHFCTLGGLVPANGAGAVIRADGAVDQGKAGVEFGGGKGAGAREAEGIVDVGPGMRPDGRRREISTGKDSVGELEDGRDGVGRKTAAHLGWRLWWKRRCRRREFGGRGGMGGESLVNEAKKLAG